MNNAATNFGLSGLSDDHYDAFIGKKARSRRKERRSKRKERKEIRFERRKLKNDDRRADTESKRAETKVMKATMMPGATPTLSSVQPMASAAPVSAPQPTTVASAPQQAGMGSNTLMIVVGVLVVGGFLFMNNKGKTQELPAPVSQ